MKKQQNIHTKFCKFIIKEIMKIKFKWWSTISDKTNNPLSPRTFELYSIAYSLFNKFI